MMNVKFRRKWNTRMRIAKIPETHFVPPLTYDFFYDVQLAQHFSAGFLLLLLFLIKYRAQWYRWLLQKDIFADTYRYNVRWATVEYNVDANDWIWMILAFFIFRITKYKRSEFEGSTQRRVGMITHSTIHMKLIYTLQIWKINTHNEWIETLTDKTLIERMIESGVVWLSLALWIIAINKMNSFSTIFDIKLFYARNDNNAQWCAALNGKSKCFLFFICGQAEWIYSLFFYTFSSFPILYFMIIYAKKKSRTNRKKFMASRFCWFC